ncbi:MAG: LysR family transcriptional regulator [Pseudomonadota bacterium]
MNHWTQLHTALQVAKYGTVSGAAAALGVHRATVNRHIESLEAALGATLFQRHARGYTPTEAGLDMLEVAGRADDMFTDLESRSRNRAGLISGELVVSTLNGVIPQVMPAIAAFQEAHPDIRLDLVGERRRTRLEYGEAHVALRAGPKPDQDDYVVLPYRSDQFGIYGHRNYLKRYGTPTSIDMLKEHRFIGLVDHGLGENCLRWLSGFVPDEAVTFRTNQYAHVVSAVCAEAGLGVLALADARDRSDLIEVMSEDVSWSLDLWIVTHVDLHRTAKVQAFVKFLRTGKRLHDATE